jgi:sulfoxide reductase heme-binding subunit YedZ
MPPSRKPQNTWVFYASGALALLVVAGILSLDVIVAPIDGVIRAGALLGYLAVFLAALSSNYMRELTRYFGRPFVKVHHVVSVTALVALAAHAIGVAWRAGTAATFLPQFSSAYLFFSLGGRPAFWIIAITALTALFRASIGAQWKTIHWLNYVAFLLGTIHAQLIGPNIAHPGVRIVSGAIAVVLVAVFVLKRLEELKRSRRKRAQDSRIQDR